jgi:hypothetical protein
MQDSIKNPLEFQKNFTAQQLEQCVLDPIKASGLAVHAIGKGSDHAHPSTTTIDRDLALLKSFGKRCYKIYKQYPLR